MKRLLALIGPCLTAAACLSSCSDSPVDNAATKPAELARYLPEDSTFIQTVDVARARDELDLPDDANALPSSDKSLPRPRNPEATLFKVTSSAYPDVAKVFSSERNGRGASPLDGTLIRAAAGESRGVSIVSTDEPIEDVERKLELAGYSLQGKVYEAGGRRRKGHRGSSRTQEAGGSCSQIAQTSPGKS